MNEINEILSYIIPKEKNIHWRTITIVGSPESGKTNLAFYITKRVIEEKGEENVNVIYIQHLKNAFLFFDKKPYQLILVEDAIRGQGWRFGTTAEGTEVIADFYEIRHIFRRKARKNKATIMIIFITQRWKSLAVDFRNAPLIFFKTLLTDHYEREYIKKSLRPQYYKLLKQITRRIYALGDESAKGEFVVATAWDQNYYVRGIPRVEPFLDVMDRDLPNPIEEIIQKIIKRFGEDILTLPDAIIKGYVKELENELKMRISSDIVYIAKYRAYELYGLPRDTIDEDSINKLMKNINIHFWQISSQEERLGYILDMLPDLNEKQAKKLMYILSYKLAKNSNKKKKIVRLDKLDKQIIAMRLRGNKQKTIAEKVGLGQPAIARRLGKIQAYLNDNASVIIP